MTVLQKILCITTLSLVTHFCYAFSDSSNNAFKLTLINHSNATLLYTGVTGANSGNIFSFDTNILSPGSTVTLTGITIPAYDLSGALHFADSFGMNNVLTILDYRKIHAGQPIFAMNNARFMTLVKSKTFNKEGNFSSLTYSAATIEIKNSI